MEINEEEIKMKGKKEGEKKMTQNQIKIIATSSLSLSLSFCLRWCCMHNLIKTGEKNQRNGNRWKRNKYKYNNTHNNRSKYCLFFDNSTHGEKQRNKNQPQNTRLT